MNFLIFKLSRRQRFMLALAFTILNFVQIFLGILTVGWSIYVCVSISHNLYSEKAEIIFVFTVTCMYGTHVIIHYLIGIKISEKCFNRAHKRSTKKHLICWILAGCNIIANIFVVAVLARYVSSHIVKSMKHSLEKGIRFYLRDADWKIMIDQLQVDFQCCGIASYKDWHNITWLSSRHLDIKSEVVKGWRLTSDVMHFPVIPWSCCKLDFPMQCLHDPLQQVQSAHLWREQPEFVLESINNEGCLKIIKSPIEKSLTAFVLVGSLIVILQLCIIVLSRLVYTSSRNAVVLRDPYGYSPGWVFGRNFCSMQKNRTLSKIMLDLSTEAERLAIEKQILKEAGTSKKGSHPDKRDPISVKPVAPPKTAESKPHNPSPVVTGYAQMPAYFYADEISNSLHARRTPGVTTTSGSPTDRHERRESNHYHLRNFPTPPPFPPYHNMITSARDSEHDPISSAEEDALMIRN